ncbi:MAG: hypothetical protein Q7S64_01915 [bacterium]|nr:hypothetical protein [bacterium]
MVASILIFAVAALIISVILVAVSFHVARYRYHNDASVFVFTSICVIYLLMTVLTFTFFKYSSGQITTTSPKPIFNSL